MEGRVGPPAGEQRVTTGFLGPEKGYCSPGSLHQPSQPEAWVHGTCLRMFCFLGNGSHLLCDWWDRWCALTVQQCVIAVVKIRASRETSPARCLFPFSIYASVRYLLGPLLANKKNFWFQPYARIVDFCLFCHLRNSSSGHSSDRFAFWNTCRAGFPYDDLGNLVNRTEKAQCSKPPFGIRSMVSNLSSQVSSFQNSRRVALSWESEELVIKFINSGIQLVLLLWFSTCLKWRSMTVSMTGHTLRLNKAYVFLQYFFLKFLNFSSSLTLKSPGKSILTLKFCFFISVWSHMCPTAQICIHSFSKHSLNNCSMWHPGFLGAAHGCIRFYSYSCEFVVWKQEAVVNMHKESGRHELYSSSTSNLLESTQKDWLRDGRY